MAHANLTSLPSHSFPQVPEQNRVKEFQQLLNARDAIAYQAVAVAQCAVAFAEAQTFEESIADFKKVLAKFESAELAINRFYEAQSQKETI